MERRSDDRVVTTPEGACGVLDVVEHVHEGARLFAQRGLPASWVSRLWDEVASGDFRHVERAAPEHAGGGVVVVKAYRRRAVHGFVRRLRAGRAAREAAGYRAFAERGLVSVDLLAWGERRRRALLELGFVVTRRLEVGTLADRYLHDFDVAPIAAAFAQLMRIHAAGVTHGDARMRNYLDTRPEPIAFDLASWRVASADAITRDLATFLGSALLLTGDESLVERLLDQHEAERGLPRPRAHLWARIRATERTMRCP